MARSSCASSGGNRRLTLPESPAAFLKANTRFVKNKQSKMCVGIIEDILQDLRLPYI